MNPNMFSKQELDTLRSHKIVTIGDKRYRMCAECRQIVCVNKLLFGSVHYCE